MPKIARINGYQQVSRTVFPFRNQPLHQHVRLVGHEIDLDARFLLVEIENRFDQLLVARRVNNQG
ncbi:hypothetical protein MnTg04_01544 [bacterium MnTg04]|nr:hypothetical protein MnTg04_01544 [bacterium MnTg04]